MACEERKIAARIQQELIGIWEEHCIDETVRYYNRDVKKLKKKYRKQGIKIKTPRKLYMRLEADVIIHGKRFWIDLWPMADESFIWSEEERKALREAVRE